MVGREIEEVEKEIESKPKYIITEAEYRENIKEGKLLGLKCKDCAQVTAPPMMVCQRCGSKEMDRIELKGAGELMTFTVLHVPPESFEPSFVFCMVKLQEGPWIPARLDYDPAKAEEDVEKIVGKEVKFKGAASIKDITDKHTVGDRVVPLFEVVK